MTTAVCPSCPVTPCCCDLQVIPLLKDPAKNWQPADFLPESSDPDFLDKVNRGDLRQGAIACTCEQRQPPSAASTALTAASCTCCITTTQHGTSLLLCVMPHPCRLTTAAPLAPHVAAQVRALRKRTDNLPDDYLVVFVGA